MYKDTTIQSVAKQFAVSPDEIKLQKCSKGDLCSFSILDRYGDVRRLIILPARNTGNQIEKLCNTSENILIIAPKSYVDYSICEKNVLGRGIFESVGAVNLFWNNDGVKLVGDDSGIVQGRQRR